MFKKELKIICVLYFSGPCWMTISVCISNPLKWIRLYYFKSFLCWCWFMPYLEIKKTEHDEKRCIIFISSFRCSSIKQFTNFTVFDKQAHSIKKVWVHMKLCLMRIMTVREYTCSNKKVKDKTNSPFGGEVGDGYLLWIWTLKHAQRLVYHIHFERTFVVSSR